MTVVTERAIVSDAELAEAAAAGDRRAFAVIYDRYANRLHDFCIGMVRDRDTAADCVQDVFCTAAAQLPKLRDPDKLRPWLYAIARNEALRHIRDRRREQVSDELPEAVSGEAGPDTLARRTELADLISAAAGGLSERDRAALELAYRHGLDGPELGEALGVSAGTANRIVSRLRETIAHSLGALLVARRARTTGNGCPELGAVLEGWDGQFSVLMRKRIARHIESCPACELQRRRLVNPVALYGGAPFFIPAPGWLRHQALSQIRLSCATVTPTAGPHTGSSLRASHSARPSTTSSSSHDAIRDGGRARVDAHAGHIRLAGLVALSAGALITSLGLTIAWLHHPTTAISPIDLSVTAPSPGNPGPRPAGVTPDNRPPSPPSDPGATAPMVTTPSQPPAPSWTHTPTAPSTSMPPPPAVPMPPPPAVPVPPPPAALMPPPPAVPMPPSPAPTVPVWVLPPNHVPPLQMPSGPKTGSPTTPTAHPRSPTPPVLTSSTPTPSSQRQLTQ